MEKEFQYKCENCGECCKHGNPSFWDASLDDGNGNCIYLDLKTNLCTIYSKRPIFCRTYEYYYKLCDNTKISLNDYLIKQQKGCDALRILGNRN